MALALEDEGVTVQVPIGADLIQSPGEAAYDFWSARSPVPLGARLVPVHPRYGCVASHSSCLRAQVLRCLPHHACMPVGDSFGRFQRHRLPPCLPCLAPCSRQLVAHHLGPGSRHRRAVPARVLAGRTRRAADSWRAGGSLNAPQSGLQREHLPAAPQRCIRLCLKHSSGPAAASPSCFPHYLFFDQGLSSELSASPAKRKKAFMGVLLYAG